MAASPPLRPARRPAQRHRRDSTLAATSTTRWRATAAATPICLTRFCIAKKLIAGCTCNGRTAFGLAPLTTAGDDPTLQPGDVLATQQGLVAVNSSGQFTPAASYAGFSPADRAHFSQMKVTPPDGVPRNTVAAQKPITAEPKAALNTR